MRVRGKHGISERRTMGELKGKETRTDLILDFDAVVDHRDHVPVSLVDLVDQESTGVDGEVRSGSAVDSECGEGRGGKESEDSQDKGGESRESHGCEEMRRKR